MISSVQSRSGARDCRRLLEIALELKDDDRGLAANDRRLVELRNALLVVAVQALGKVDLVHAEAESAPADRLLVNEALQDED